MILKPVVILTISWLNRSISWYNDFDKKSKISQVLWEWNTFHHLLKEFIWLVSCFLVDWKRLIFENESILLWYAYFDH